MRLLGALSVLLAASAASALPRPIPPVISQRFPHGRTADYHGDSRCGPTSMAMVARGFHREPRLSDAQLIEKLDQLDDGKVNSATTPAGIVRMSQALDLRARVHVGFDAEWLRAALARGGLVVALGRPRYLPETEAHTGGHFVDVVGLTRKGKFIVNDGYRRTSKRGRRYQVTEAELASFVEHKPNGQLFAIYPPPPRATARRPARSRRR